MKPFAVIVPLLLVGCAGSQTSDTGPVARCETTDCFYERDIRDFEVIDRETLIVYVGRQRCPFVVELDGFSCDLTFTPQLDFFQRSPGGLRDVPAVPSGQVCSSSRSLYVYAGILDPGGELSPNTRIDPRTGRAVEGGGFDNPGMRGGGLERRPLDNPLATDDVCRVRDIQSINDDQLLELYVDQGVMPPPPPIGAGEIEVPEQNTTGSGSAGASQPEFEDGEAEESDAESQETISTQ